MFVAWTALDAIDSSMDQGIFLLLLSCACCPFLFFFSFFDSLCPKAPLFLILKLNSTSPPLMESIHWPFLFLFQGRVFCRVCTYAEDFGFRLLFLGWVTLHLNFRSRNQLESSPAQIPLPLKAVLGPFMILAQGLSFILELWWIFYFRGPFFSSQKRYLLNWLPFEVGRQL